MLKQAFVIGLVEDLLGIALTILSVKRCANVRVTLPVDVILVELDFLASATTHATSESITSDQFPHSRRQVNLCDFVSICNIHNASKYMRPINI